MDKKSKKIRLKAIKWVGYNASLKDPVSWFARSLKLMNSSKELRKNFPDESGLLAGYAFELLIKCYLVCENNFSGKELPKMLLSHDLVQLRVQIKFLGKSSKENNKILRSLIEYVIWKGRYPIPLRSDDLLHSEDLNFKEIDKLWDAYLKKFPEKLDDSLKVIAEFISKKN